MTSRPATPLGRIPGLDPALVAALESRWILTAEEWVAAEAGAGRLPDPAHPRAEVEPGLRFCLERLDPATRQALGPSAAPGGLGCLPGEVEPAEPLAAEGVLLGAGAALGEPVPAAADLRHRLGPARDQGGRGACVGFACVALMEAAFHWEEWRAEFSEQFLYWQCKQLDRQAGEGTSLAHAKAALERHGACHRATWPYSPMIRRGNVGHGPPPPGAEAEAARHTLAGCALLARPPVEALKRMLAGTPEAPGGPVVVGIEVHASWYLSEMTRRSGRIHLPLPHDTLVGGHAVCLVGYRDDPRAPGGGYFLARNSWGEAWARESEFGPGHGLLPYEHARQGRLLGALACPGAEREGPPRGGAADPFARFLRAVPACAPQAERREWLGYGESLPQGALLPPGPARVILHPAVPGEFRLDTPRNRRQFSDQWFGWSPRGREASAREALERAPAGLARAFEDARLLGGAGAAVVARNLARLQGLLGGAATPGQAGLAGALADLSEEFARVWEGLWLLREGGVAVPPQADLALHAALGAFEKAAGPAAWPAAWRRLLREANSLALHAAATPGGSWRVVVGSLCLPTFERGESGPMAGLAGCDGLLWDILGSLARRAGGVGRREGLAFSLGLAGGGGESLPPPACLPQGPAVAWHAGPGTPVLRTAAPAIPPPGLADLLEAMAPVPFEARHAKVAAAVQTLRDHGYMGEISVARIAGETSERPAVALEAFLEMQRANPAEFMVCKAKRADDVEGDPAALGRVTIEDPRRTVARGPRLGGLGKPGLLRRWLSRR